MAIRYLVNTQDKGLISLETFPCHRWVKELCENREFESHQQLQNILRVIDISEEAYNRGLGCPRDAREAVELVRSLSKVEFETAVVTSKESGKKVYDDCRELAKQGRIIYYTMPQDPCTGRDCWLAEVITGVKKGA